MDAFDADRFVAEILASPDAEQARAEIAGLTAARPADAATVLERLAAVVATTTPARAARWLTEAAALWAGAAENPGRASRALRAAIEIAPGDETALAHLLSLYRENGKHRSLVRILERRAEALMESAGGDPEARRRAADAFTLLGDLLRDPPLDSAAEAIAAYHEAVATGAASPAAFDAARALYLAAGQLSNVLPLFALERARTTDAARLGVLAREEEAVTLRIAHAENPADASIATALSRAIAERLLSGEAVRADECIEAAVIFEARAGKIGDDEDWRRAERCYAAAERWEDAAWAAERRGDYARALEMLGRAATPTPEDRVRLGLREARLCAVGLGDARRAAARWAALLGDLPAIPDAATLERLARADRGGGDVADAAARLEAAALGAGDMRALKMAFALSAQALSGTPRAAELCRQADVLAGLGAERAPAMRHGEAGLDGLVAADALPFLERLAALSAPDDAVDLYARHLGRVTEAEAPAALELLGQVAVQRGSLPRLGRFFEEAARDQPDARSLEVLERAAADADKKRGGNAVRALLAAALGKVEPAVLDGGRTRAALLRRAAHIARRDLADPDQAAEWLADALFARLEGALEDALAPLSEQTEALRALTADLARREGGARATPPPPPPRPATIPPPVPVRAAPLPAVAGKPLSIPAPAIGDAGAAQRAPTRPPPTPPVPRILTPAPPTPPVPRILTPVPPPLEAMRDPFPAPAPAPPPSQSNAVTQERTRLAGEDLIGDLFESMHALDFCKDAVDAASFTLALAMAKLASPIGLAHLYDINRREFVVVQASGPGTAVLKGVRTADVDPLAAEAMRTPGALILREGAMDPRGSGKRWEMVRVATDRALGAIACARVAQGGRFLGMIELAGGGFAAGDEHALGYMAERFAEFVAQHGVVLDPEG